MSEQHIVVMPPPRGVEPASERIRRLQAEARNLAREHIDELKATLVQVARLAEEVSAGGELYPVGAREFARRLAEEAERQTFALTAILERH